MYCKMTFTYCYKSDKIMIVECIKKPDAAKYTETAVTVGKTYHVISKDDNDYELVDDNGDELYYQLEHFIEIDE